MDTQVTQEERAALLAKEPWEMTYVDYHNSTLDNLKKVHPQYYRAVLLWNTENQKIYSRQSKRFHKNAIQQAISKGKPVPQHVLAEYK